MAKKEKYQKYQRMPSGKLTPVKDIVPSKYRPKKPKTKHLPSRQRTKGVK